MNQFKISKGQTMHPEMVKIIRWQFEGWLKNKLKKNKLKK